MTKDYAPFEIEYCAKICHAINRAYCAAIGDDSQPTWKEAPKWQKESAIAGVKFHIENPNASPSASHESWLAVKNQEGWRWGPHKDPVIKEHPCMLPFNELPLEQQVKDHLFRATVHAVLAFRTELSPHV